MSIWYTDILLNYRYKVIDTKNISCICLPPYGFLNICFMKNYVLGQYFDAKEWL